MWLTGMHLTNDVYRELSFRHVAPLAIKAGYRVTIRCNGARLDLHSELGAHYVAPAGVLDLQGCNIVDSQASLRDSATGPAGPSVHALGAGSVLMSDGRMQLLCAVRAALAPANAVVATRDQMPRPRRQTFHTPVEILLRAGSTLRFLFWRLRNSHTRGHGTACTPCHAELCHSRSSAVVKTPAAVAAEMTRCSCQATSSHVTIA